MSFAGILFIATGLACLLGLISSLSNPAWFRFNGKVPARWKIARLWLLLAAICAIFALVHREPAVPNSAPVTETTETTTTMPDGASVFQIDPGPSVDAAADDVVRDAVRAADEGVQDAARAADDAMPIDLPTPPPPSKRLHR